MVLSLLHRSSGAFNVISNTAKQSIETGRLQFARTSKFLVSTERSSRNTSSLYFPAGQPFGFEMWNSVWSRLFGAILRDSSTTWPSSNVHARARFALLAAPSVAPDA